jgi:transcriptional regulator with XRE-family HTH domain
MPQDVSNPLTSCQQHFADGLSRKPPRACVARGVTDEDFRGWVRDWFKHQVETRGGDNDRAFAKIVGLTPTEVNDIRNDKRYPSWNIIAKTTDALGVRADDFLIDLASRARAASDAVKLKPAATSATPARPTRPTGPTVVRVSARARAEADEVRPSPPRASPPAAAVSAQTPKHRRTAGR